MHGVVVQQLGRARRHGQDGWSGGSVLRPGLAGWPRWLPRRPSKRLCVSEDRASPPDQVSFRSLASAKTARGAG